MAEHERSRHEPEDKTTWRKKADSVSDRTKAREETEGKPVGPASLEGHAALLGDARLSHAANAGQRAEILTELQRTHGNAYVQRLLKSRAVQAKLTVNQPGDIHEKEADAVAEAVTRTSQVQRQEEEEEAIQPKRATNLAGTGLQRQEEEEEVAPKATGSQVPEVTEALENRISAARGTGHELPGSVRDSMEPQLGHDFGDVRVHTDSEADDLSRQLGARAFTTGQDVFFRSGDYQPESQDGRKLIAHEMTHVVQQGSAPVYRKPVETEEDASLKDRRVAEVELKKLAQQALSDMSRESIKALLYQASYCQQTGSAEAAKDALDQVANQALGILKRKANVFTIETSSRKVALDILDQLAKSRLHEEGGQATSANAMMGQLLLWAQEQVAGSMAQLQRAPSAVTAKFVLERAALLVLLGGDTRPAVSALMTWAETEKA